MWRKQWIAILLASLFAADGVEAADLSVADVVMPAGTTADVVVSGNILGESTFGVTIFVEVVPRGGNIGTVTFTSAPPVDIVQLGDPWPGSGTFSAFDTDMTGSVLLNGSVDDNGTFVAGPLTFTGTLVRFPVAASADAAGVWDVVLSTSSGNSNWEGLVTTLVAGTITASQAECFTDPDCSDGVFCNGVETCVSSTCVAGSDPCPGQVCDEAAGACVECLVDADCTDGVFCNGAETCVSNICVAGSSPCLPAEFCNETTDACDECQLDLDCDDGLFCNGAELCVSGSCGSGTDPCPGQTCDEPSAGCVPCLTDAECDDGLFCTGVETCVGGSCVAGTDPCGGLLCDEGADFCLPDSARMTAEDLVLLAGSTGTVIVTGDLAGDATFGSSLFVEIVPRVGSTGTVTFTASPPVDIVQLDDPWPGIGTFSAFDTDTTSSVMLNGSTDDNGTFVPAPMVFSGQLVGFPVEVSADAGGIWDVYLSTSAGDSTWEGVTTTLVAGTITVNPEVGLTVNSMAMPPSATVNVVVSGKVQNRLTYGVTVLVELIPQAGAIGTLTFTPSPPVDVFQAGDPWPFVGTFTPFDTDSTGSVLLNGAIDDNGSFLPGMVGFSGDLAVFPVIAGAGADGVWTMTLTTTTGTSSWEQLSTVLIDGTVTVTPGACVVDLDCDDTDPCTTDTCNAGVCEYASVVGACDDSDPCTENDTCVANVCAGTPKDCSGLDDSCNSGSCNPVSGVCEPIPANDGGVCDDGDLCMENDTCLSGVCSGTPLDCSGLDDTCNVGTCDPGTGLCQATPANEGGACSDLDPCTSNDQCINGTCTGDSLQCGYLSNPPCGVGVCDPATTTCVLFPLGGTCDDGDPCTVADRCSGGFCVGDPKDCTGQDDACNVGVCNAATGACEQSPANDGGTCDDGNGCTNTDICATGVCAGSLIPGCVTCAIDATCDDGEFCTVDFCDGLGVCQHTNLTNPCSDGDACTVNDTCSGGICTGTPVDCSFLSGTCSLGQCNPSNGVCFAFPINEGLACDDGFACTAGDLCTNAECIGTLVGSPGVDLGWSPSLQTAASGDLIQIDLIATSATCLDHPVGSIEVILIWDPAKLALVGNTDNGPFSWLESRFPDDSGLDGLNAPYTGVPANDGDAKYQAVAGFLQGVDVSPAGLNVTTIEFQALDGTLGTDIGIIPSAGLFTHTRVLGAESLLGMDLTGTVATATVQITECQINADCDDGNICTDESCNTGVCAITNNTLPCDDGLFCTAGDACTGGVCMGSGDPCSLPLQCSETLGACVACLSDADCNDGNPCTDDTCDAAGSCQNPSNTLPCDDGQFCTANDTCAGGVCVGGGSPCSSPPELLCDELGAACVECFTPADCNDGNVCTDDSCVANVCQNIPNSAPCNDNLFCTTNDTCSGGACVGGPSPCTPPALLCDDFANICVECFLAADCDDGNLCTDDNCVASVCQFSPNTVPCEDGLWCNGQEVCAGGACQPGTAPDCDDGVSCTGDSCDESTDQCQHVPDDVPCDNGVFCDGPEFCHLTLGCRPGSPPCDDPALCVEATGLCGCQEPIVAAEGSRYLAVTPRAGATPVALKVVGGSVDVACLTMYVQDNGTLGPTPVFKTPSGPDGWGTAHIFGIEIMPSNTYIVQTECDMGGGTMGVSTTVGDTTWMWGDTDNSGGLITILDATLILDGFRGMFTFATLYAIDLWGVSPTNCIPDQQIDIADVTRAVDAFRQFPYPCAGPCP